MSLHLKNSRKFLYKRGSDDEIIFSGNKYFIDIFLHEYFNA